MKKRLLSILVLFVVALSLVSCGKKEDPTPQPRNPLPQLNMPANGDTIVTITTTKGVIQAVLFDKAAPQTVNNFIKLADSGYYDGMIIHKVIKDFVVQMGDPTAEGNGGESFNGAGIPLEYNELLHNFTGALGMAAGTDGLAYSQFYIVAGTAVSEEYVNAMKSAGYASNVIAAYQELGGLPSLDYEYTVFGQVYEGMDVVDAIANLATGAGDKPLEDVKILSIDVETL